MKILHFYPSNKRSVSLETYLIELQKLNHEVFVLTTIEKGSFHSFLNEHNIPSESTNVNSSFKLVYYMKQLLALRRFCVKNEIDFVFSHLQHANIIAVFAQYFIKSKVIVFRHHFTTSSDIPPSKTEKMFDRTINFLAQKIIVASSEVRNKIIESEKIDSTKIRVIPYIYNFDQYELPSMEKVQEIRSRYDCKLLLLMCSRFVKNKRHELVFKLMQKWVFEDQMDIQLMLLDEGPLYDSHKKLVESMNLDKNIHFIGYTPNFTNYMASADLLIHPSISETSSSTVKEMGILSKIVAVCKNVGDFEEYISDNYNGFLLSEENTSDDLDQLILKIYSGKHQFEKLGENLNSTVIEKFGLGSKTMKLYEELLTT